MTNILAILEKVAEIIGAVDSLVGKLQAMGLKTDVHVTSSSPIDLAKVVAGLGSAAAHIPAPPPQA